MIELLNSAPNPRRSLLQWEVAYKGSSMDLLEIPLGNSTADVARGIFSALRELDREDVGAILVEGIDEGQGDTAIAVMNRIRKAAEIKPND